MPLTQERAKPAVPFGGKYRIIDFVLSNLINSGIYSIYVLVQFMSQPLLRHLRDGWQFGGLLQDQVHHPGTGTGAFSRRDRVQRHG
ncbi:MAG: sugar phosphate nucleotidyltransferase [Acidobacteriaceae bacterium]